jgi:hypothetical protein
LRPWARLAAWSPHLEVVPPTVDRPLCKSRGTEVARGAEETSIARQSLFALRRSRTCMVPHPRVWCVRTSGCRVWSVALAPPPEGFPLCRWVPPAAFDPLPLVRPVVPPLGVWVCRTCCAEIGSSRAESRKRKPCRMSRLSSQHSHAFRPVASCVRQSCYPACRTAQRDSGFPSLSCDVSPTPNFLDAARVHARGNVGLGRARTRSSHSACAHVSACVVCLVVASSNHVIKPVG